MQRLCNSRRPLPIRMWMDKEPLGIPKETLGIPKDSLRNPSAAFFLSATPTK